MNKIYTITNQIPAKLTHPGVILAQEFEAREITQRYASRQLNVDVTVLNNIIKGRRKFTVGFALALEKFIGIPADFWMRLQIKYEIDKARALICKDVAV